jgi:hypothetical protein
MGDYETWVRCLGKNGVDGLNLDLVIILPALGYYRDSVMKSVQIHSMEVLTLTASILRFFCIRDSYLPFLRLSPAIFRRPTAWTPCICNRLRTLWPI